MPLSRRQLVLGGMILPIIGTNGAFAVTDQMRGYAQTAWRYFEANTNPQTGLAPSANAFPSMTFWDQGAYLFAVVSAFRLGLISEGVALDRLTTLFRSVANLSLFKNLLPNKAYNIATLEKTDYANNPSAVGIGYSALDILRFLGGVAAALTYFPKLAPDVKDMLANWQLDALHGQGRLTGGVLRDGAELIRRQEGRIGYEQYGARIALLYGLPVQQAANYAPILRWQNYFGLRIPGDIRTKISHGVSSLTTSEPFILDALESGWDPDTRPIGQAIYDVQKLRAKRTGILTALSEDHIKGAPYFAYHCLLEDRRPFVSVTSQRKDVSDLRALSTKAAFAWHALMRDDYSQSLIQAVADLQTAHGWYAGRFENDGRVNQVLSLNTNAVILEALHYQAFGPILTGRPNT